MNTFRIYADRVLMAAIASSVPKTDVSIAHFPAIDYDYLYLIISKQDFKIDCRINTLFMQFLLLNRDTALLQTRKFLNRELEKLDSASMKEQDYIKQCNNLRDSHRDVELLYDSLHLFSWSVVYGISDDHFTIIFLIPESC